MFNDPMIAGLFLLAAGAFGLIESSWGWFVIMVAGAGITVHALGFI